MSTIKVILTVFPILALVASCATAQRSKPNNKPHHEDLTSNRLTFPVLKDSVLKKEDEPDFELLSPDSAVTEAVNSVLDSIANFNRDRLFIDGYTIQIYSGLKRDEAMNAKKKVMDEIKDLVTDIHYQQPKWTLKTGHYFTRLEAQRDLRRLKQIVSTVILVPEKVALK